MLAATVALEAVLAGRDRERAIAMARFALDGDQLIAVDDGLFWVNAAAVRILSDDDIGDFWSRARTASHARGSLFAALSTSLWEGFWQWRRGELHEALACLRAALDQDRLWGGTRVGEPFARAFQIGCHLDRGDLAAARQAADAFAGGAAFGEGGRVYQQAVARLLVAEGRSGEALVVLGNPHPTDDGIAIVNPVWNPWRSIKAAALFGLGRTSEAIEAAEEELALLRIWGAPSFLGRALCMLGEFRGRAGLDNLVEAVELLSTTTAAVDLARAQSALGSHPDVAGEDAIALLEAASRTAEQRGAGQVRERVRAELERRGRRIEPGTGEVLRLSRTDRQILDLTAAGLDVHEVAQRLFVTPGTVRDVLDGAGFAAEPGGSRISQVGQVTMTHDQNGRLQ